MDETVFERVKQANTVLRLDLSPEELASLSVEWELSEEALDAVGRIFDYLTQKKTQTTC